MINLMLGDCLERMKELDDNSVDSIVTDPPYGLSFMGKHWDKGVPSAEIWAEALRVLKPGGHLLAFAGTRTQHRMAVNIEDAGFEIRDMIAWVYGSGFPKSMNVGKAIDKAAGASRVVLAERENRSTFDPDAQGGGGFQRGTIQITAPATEAAKQWDGWGTALKPALEPVTVARKPFKGTVAANVLAHGTGAINIDGCRVGAVGGTKAVDFGEATGNVYVAGAGKPSNAVASINAGRWPANGDFAGLHRSGLLRRSSTAAALRQELPRLQQPRFYRRAARVAPHRLCETFLRRHFSTALRLPFPPPYPAAFRKTQYRLPFLRRRP